MAEHETSFQPEATPPFLRVVKYSVAPTTLAGLLHTPLQAEREQPPLESFHDLR